MYAEYKMTYLTLFVRIYIRTFLAHHLSSLKVRFFSSECWSGPLYGISNSNFAAY